MVTPQGAWKTRTLRRHPEEERWRREDVESMKYTRWTTNDGATTMESSHEEQVHIDYDRDLGYDIPPKAPEPAEAIPRRVYITRQTLEKCGKTPECAGCTTAFLGGTGVNHTEFCRMRIESAMKDDTADRHRVRNAEKNSTGIRAATYARESQEIGQRRRRPYGRQTGGTLIAIKWNKFFIQRSPWRDEAECRTRS